jgi:hypothetical protein
MHRSTDANLSLKLVVCLFGASHVAIESFVGAELFTRSE